MADELDAFLIGWGLRQPLSRPPHQPLNPPPHQPLALPPQHPLNVHQYQPSIMPPLNVPPPQFLTPHDIERITQGVSSNLIGEGFLELHGYHVGQMISTGLDHRITQLGNQIVHRVRKAVVHELDKKMRSIIDEVVDLTSDELELRIEHILAEKKRDRAAKKMPEAMAAAEEDTAAAGDGERPSRKRKRSEAPSPEPSISHAPAGDVAAAASAADALAK